MKCDKFPLTGFTEDKQFSIYGDAYSYTFMKNQLIGSQEEKIETDNGFIRGYLHNGGQIAIACERDIYANGYCPLNSYGLFLAYGIYDHKVTDFTDIIFVGGTLKQLFKPECLSVDFHEGMLINHRTDAKKYNFTNNGEECEASILSVFSWNNSYGTQIRNDEVQLRIHFSNKKPFRFAVDCYNNVLNCLKFMTNRINVGFDSIYVCSTDGEGTSYDHDQFSVFINEEYDVLTDKDYYRNLTFEDLDDNFGQLLELFFVSTGYQPKYSLGFYPKDDHDLYRINNDRIRSICAALEFEAEEEKLKDECSELKELIKICKKCVKWYRKTHDSIDKSTYDRIFTGFSHWSFSAREKVQILWSRHRGSMDVLTRQLQRYYKLDIGEFIEYRNRITHGAETQATEDVAATALALRGLVYCCVLKRIGVSEERIIELGQYKINS